MKRDSDLERRIKAWRKEIAKLRGVSSHERKRLVAQMLSYLRQRREREFEVAMQMRAERLTNLRATLATAVLGEPPSSETSIDVSNAFGSSNR